MDFLVYQDGKQVIYNFWPNITPDQPGMLQPRQEGSKVVTYPWIRGFRRPRPAFQIPNLVITLFVSDVVYSHYPFFH